MATWAMFDDAVQAQFGIRCKEFIQRWNHGGYAEIADEAGHRPRMLIEELDIEPLRDDWDALLRRA
jgi:hypothetical protein